MARKWFQLVGEDGNAVTSTTAVHVDIEDVDALRDAVKIKCSNTLARVDATDLTVFANQVAYDEKQKLPKSSSSVSELGKDEDSALIVQVRRRPQEDSRYFILPEVQVQVELAVFVIVEDDEDHAGVGMGVFFSPTLAVTCDHNLTETHTVGSSVPLALKGEMISVDIVARNSELDFAILKSSSPRSFIPPWNGNPVQLRGRGDLVLASFRLGIQEYDPTRNQLGFAQASGICVSDHRRFIMYSCPTYAGDSGAALLLKDGLLVGIHLETVNALREEIERKKVIKDRLSAAEESLDNIARSGLAQGCSGLLVHEFKDVVR